MTSTRVLVAARLSRVTEQGQSRIERDDEAAEKWATGREGCTIVAVSKDAGVSGGTSPWKRPQLGPWLTDPALIARYDEIVASSIDRLGRSARDLHDLRAWAEDHGKTIRILSPALVWPPSSDDFSGPIVWDVLARVAEIERKMTAKRYADVREHLRQSEALVGKPPFGFMVVGEKYGKTLALDPQLVPVLRGMIDRALAGEPFLAICRWLDAEGIEPAQTGKRIRTGAKGSGNWSPKSVANVLRNPALKGRRYEDGRTVLRFEGLLTPGQFQALQDALDGRPARRGPITAATATLTGVIECDRCGGAMYRFTSTGKARKDGTKNVLTYYRCKGTDIEPSTCGNMVPLNDIEGWVNLWFTADGPFARVEVIETTLVPGDDHQAEIEEVEAELRELDFDDPDFDERQRVLRGERARLKALPSEPSQVVEQSTGQTVGEVWQSLDGEARRTYLLAAGVKVRVMSNGTLRTQPGQEVRYVTGDPHKVIGTVRGIVATEEAAAG